jgi:large conductance mechanosensitive channel
MPPIGMLMGNVNFADLYLNLSEGTYASLEEAKAAGAATINYGVFINTVLDFIIVAFAIFLVIKQMNRLKREEKPAPKEPTTKDCPRCLTSIPIKATRCPSCTSELVAA